MNETAKAPAKKGWLVWFGAVTGWLACAGLCLLASIGLEPWPYAYDMLFPVILLLLFGNVFVFLFIVTRWGAQPGRFFGSVGRVFLGEGLLLAGLYALGRFAIAT